INDIKDPDKFGSWALRIVFTKSMDVLRLNSKNRKRKEQYSNEQERLKGEEVDIEPLKTKLLDAIKALPAHQQMVIKLFYVEDYNLKEIAELLTINVGTVKSRLFHARETLKQTLKQYNYENK
ncbi:MAG: sigma-70 family RNA polymerase sigma factor, partial [Bacteroidia bacterium]|nr:sigma-70 family RNA polymerase sigma factor [Bacteroidia bacterium]